MIPTIEHIWDLFLKIIWPAVLAYAAYLHKRVENTHMRIDQLQREVYDQKTEVHKTFATHDSVSQLENKLVSMLNRIDDKVTRILEERK